MRKLLTGHTSEATAYLQEDYPYSFTLRCQRRVWIETREGFGQRVVTQTQNPKTGRWNKPKPGVYHLLVVMLLNDENGYVEFEMLSPYNLEQVHKFREIAEPALSSRDISLLNVLEKRLQK